MYELTTPIHHKIYTLDFIFQLTKETDAKVMGFLRGKWDA